MAAMVTSTTLAIADTGGVPRPVGPEHGSDSFRDDENVVRDTSNPRYGLSVRCVQGSKVVLSGQLHLSPWKSMLLDQIGVEGVRLLSCWVHK